MSTIPVRPGRGWVNDAATWFNLEEFFRWLLESRNGNTILPR